MGGFHVSGCLSMLDGRAVELDACRELGVSMFAGEAEGRLDTILRDAAAGQTPAALQFHERLPGIEGTPVPFLPKRYVERTLGLCTSFDAGRGCPYQCSFCTIINVQGRKSRFRSCDDIEHLVRLNWAQGVNKFFITDDNFARNKDWEAIFDRLIDLRENHGIPLGLMIQVDTLCHKIPNFIEKAKRAGVTRVFIGLENVNPDNLAGAKKRQNKVSEYRRMLLAWKAHGIMTLAGYILGFPADTPETIRRDIAIIKRELPLDIIEFFCLTPLPGSEDHQTLWKKNGPHASGPERLRHNACLRAASENDRGAMAWDLSGGLVALLFARAHGDVAAARRGDRPADGQPHQDAGDLRDHGGSGKSSSAEFRAVPDAPPERECGRGCRAKAPGYSGRALRCDVVRKHAGIVMAIGGLLRAWLSIARDPNAKAYMDQALMPVGDDDDATLDLMTKTTGVAAALSHQKKVAELTHAVHAA